MPRNTTVKISKEHLILCEGRDAYEFLIRYLNSSALSGTPGFSNDIQVMDFGGNSELPAYLELVQLSPGFDMVTSLTVIRDAETDADAAVNEIRKALKNANFPVPEKPHIWAGSSPKIGFLLFPTCDHSIKNGTLEDLCLSILSENHSQNILYEIDFFLHTLEKHHNRKFPRIFKNRLHTYLSTHNDYVSCKIGEAAAIGAFDWNSSALDALRDFLSEALLP